jgi:RsiW-degrading membrane proteinase PrsW (M82 family)
MDIRANLAIAVAPALLLLWLFKKWDEKRPEPPGAVRNVVIFGALMCLPAAGIELAMSALLGREIVELQGQFVNAFLIAAFTEEMVKLALVMLWVWRKPHFDEVMDGILYTAAASLGFALLENVLYSAGNPITGFVRAFTAVPLHATCSGIMGYFVGRGKMTKGSAVPWIIGGLFAAVFIHGFYDWIVFSGAGFGFFEPMPLVALAVVVVLVGICGLILRAMVKHALSMDDSMLGPQSRPLTPAVAYPQPGYVSQPGGYPQGTYPQPGYVSQPGYPPQPGAVPPAPFPQQQYPQQQYPQQQYPQQQYPQQQYPQQQYPQQQYPQQQYPQQQYPQQPPQPQQPQYPQQQNPQQPGYPPPPGGYDPNRGGNGYGS